MGILEPLGCLGTSLYYLAALLLRGWPMCKLKHLRSCHILHSAYCRDSVEFRESYTSPAFLYAVLKKDPQPKSTILNWSKKDLGLCWKLSTVRIAHSCAHIPQWVTFCLGLGAAAGKECCVGLQPHAAWCRCTGHVVWMQGRRDQTTTVPWASLAKLQRI